ncbi:MAG: hypothetical protein K5790_05665 [Nitrosopumilus sp.]|uniref:hypothetical protein n=1 Tax=Nitrosopumilus sp. TaxID=2024843 RepID=UPI00247D700E|nr:hypothetical protein [Nitrosopumilus sp.]MCV0392767.1 hypothetical protein [Nitrosopumilus sp.]
MYQNNSQRVVKLVFTPAQIEEQKQFVDALENNTTDIVFEGSILEAKSYLAGIEQLVDSSLH